MTRMINEQKVSQEGFSPKFIVRWAIFLCPLFILPFAIKPYWSKRSIIALVIATAAISILSTLLYGYAVGRRRLWQKRIGPDTLVSTAGVMICYILTMIIANSNDPSASNAAAVGFIIFVLPVAIVFVAILSIGAGIGHITLPSEVAGPKGDRWTVRMQLVPDRQGIGLYERFVGRLNKKKKKNEPGRPQKKKGFRWLDFIFNSPDSIDDIRIMLIIFAVAILFYFIGWPLLLLLIDFIWLVLVLLGALISFVILGRPVTIAARSENEFHSWKVRGINNALKEKQEIMKNISNGIKLHSD